MIKKHYTLASKCALSARPLGSVSCGEGSWRRKEKKGEGGDEGEKGGGDDRNEVFGVGKIR